MRNSLFLFFFIGSFFSFSQNVPQKINYQGIARHADGTPITNKPISIRFRLLQGSSSGTSVFTETQSVATGPLGVFSSQIGSVNSLSAVSWSNSPYFLEVGLDTTNGNNFVVLGTQELVSTPYALYAGSAPSPSLSFNSASGVLNVGTSSVVIPPSASSQSTTINTSGAIGSTLTGTTYNLNVPTVSVTATELSPGVAGGLAQVLGSFPNYTVMVSPVIAYNPTVGVLGLSSIPLTSPSYNWTYNITPQLSINGNTLYVGPPSNSITLPGPVAATPNTTLSSSGGLINISSPVTNSFDINIPPVSIMSLGSATILGTYPNYTVSTPSTLGPVSIGQGGAITVSGSNPNYTVSTPSVNVSASPGGLGSVTGSFPNYVVNVSPTFSYNNVAGALVVSNSASPAISYTYNVTQNLQFFGGVLTSGPSSNSVSIPSAVTPTIIGTNAASVTTAGNSYTVSVPVTTLVGVNGAVVTGSAPNYTVSAPQASISGSGAATVNSSGNNYTVSVPATTLVGMDGAVVLGSAPNFTVSAPQTSVAGNGAASVTSSGNSYTVSVPVTTLTGTGGAVVSGSAPNFTVNAPQASNITGIGGTTVTGTAPNFTVNTPARVSLNGGALIYPSGLLQIMGSYPSYSLLVAPSIAYSQSTGYLSLSNQPLTTPVYSYSYDITPALTKTNNVIQAGPSSNTVAITSPSAQAFAVSGAAVLVAGGTVLMSTSFTKQSSSSEIDVFLHTQASTAIGLGNFTFELVIDGNTSTVSTSHTLGGNSTEYITLKAIFAGLSAGSHTVGIKATPSGLGVLTTLNPNGYGAKLILKETY